MNEDKKAFHRKRKKIDQGRNPVKRSILLFVVIGIALSVSPAHAQRFYAGVLGGVNIADYKLWFHEGEVLEYDVKTLTFLGAGVVMGFRLTDVLSLQAEPMFQTYGGLYTEPSKPDMMMRVRVLEAPLFIMAAFGKKIRPYLMAGPIVSVRLSSEMETTISGLDYKGDMDPVLKKMALGFVFGGGIQVPLRKGWLFLEGRYSFSLGNFNKGGTLELTASGTKISQRMCPDNVLNMKNMQILVGYALPLGKK